MLALTAWRSGSGQPWFAPCEPLHKAGYTLWGWNLHHMVLVDWRTVVHLQKLSFQFNNEGAEISKGSITINVVRIDID